MYTRDSREVGQFRYRFKIRGDNGVVFDYVVEARHGAEATAQVKAQFGDRVISLQDVRPIQ
jgi:hypothetical protein